MLHISRCADETQVSYGLLDTAYVEIIPIFLHVLNGLKGTSVLTSLHGRFQQNPLFHRKVHLGTTLKPILNKYQKYLISKYLFLFERWIFFSFSQDIFHIRAANAWREYQIRTYFMNFAWIAISTMAIAHEKCNCGFLSCGLALRFWINFRKRYRT